jgi:predicted aconitase with swiveling domain
MTTLGAEFLVPGEAVGTLSVLTAPLSLWGGFDVHTGVIVDLKHPERGADLAGRILAMKEAKGSSSSASALLEAARSGKAPAAIILARLDPILVIGALVACDLYRVVIPILLLPLDSWGLLETGRVARLSSAASALTLE